MMDLNPQRSNVIDQEQNNDNENDHDEDLDVGKCNNSSRSLVSGSFWYVWGYKRHQSMMKMQNKIVCHLSPKYFRVMFLRHLLDLYKVNNV